MTEIRSSTDTRHIMGPTQVIAQIPPPPPVKSQRTSVPQIQKQNSLKREPESPGHQAQMPTFTHTTVPSTVISCTNRRSTGSVSSSPLDGPSSPKQSHSFSSDKGWRILQNEDGHLSWTQFEERHHLLGNEEDSSERHSSDDEFDIWAITDEQREYYINQFKSMQPDISGKITGTIAKDFFEKSKLPVLELSKIWQLSDVDKDGALSLEEFYTAMHLVVLRRNNIELPEVLPSSLVPRIHKVSNDSVHMPFTTNHVQVQPTTHNQNEVSPKQSPCEVSSPQNKESISGKVVQWTKFNDSPTSSLSSPGMKPVNFDFSAASVEQNPKILHPVALRLSPERQPDSESEEPPVATDDMTKVSTAIPSQIIHKSKQRKRLGPSLSAALQSIHSHGGEPEFERINAPNASNSFSGTSNSTRSNSLSHGASVTQGPKKEPPPPPPPRPKHNHTRSSSLDLNKLGSTIPHFLGVPPAVPPRMSPSTSTPMRCSLPGEEAGESSEDFADFSNFDNSENSKLQLQHKSGAFEVYKKPFPSPIGANARSSSGSETYLLEQSSTTAAADDSVALLVDIEPTGSESTADRKRHVSAPPLALAASAFRSVPQDKKELLSALKAHSERNKMLTLLNNELNQELSEVMEERIALELQLEHLKPFS